MKRMIKNTIVLVLLFSGVFIQTETLAQARQDEYLRSHESKKNLNKKTWKELSNEIRQKRYDANEPISGSELNREMGNPGTFGNGSGDGTYGDGTSGDGNGSYGNGNSGNGSRNGNSGNDPGYSDEENENIFDFRDFDGERNSEDQDFGPSRKFGRNDGSGDGSGNGNGNGDGTGGNYSDGSDDGYPFGDNGNDGNPYNDQESNPDDAFRDFEDYEKYRNPESGTEYQDVRVPESKSEPYVNPRVSEGGGGSTILIIIGVALLAAVLIYIILNSFDRKNVKVPKVVNEEDKLQNLTITKSELELAIENALKNKNYREAVRIYFIAVIKELKDRRWIRWEKKKTNYAYIDELAERKQQQQFIHASRIFEVVWYGNRNITEPDFNSVEPVFKNLLQSIDTDKAAS